MPTPLSENGERPESGNEVRGGKSITDRSPVSFPGRLQLKIN